MQQESPSSPSNVSKEFEFLNSKSPQKSALVLGSNGKTEGNLENKKKRIPDVKVLIHEKDRADHLPKLPNPDDLERFDVEKKSGGYPVSTRKALDLIRNSKNHVRRTSTVSKPEPIVPTAKSATAHALDLIRKKDVRLQRPRSIPSNTYHSGLTEAVNKAAVTPDKKHPQRNKSLVSTIETLVPPRAPTQLSFSKFSKKGRKPCYTRRAKGDISKSVNLRQKIKNPLALHKSNPPAKQKPSNGYVKVRRMLIEPHVVEIGMAELYRKRRKLIEWGIVIPRKVHTVKVPKSVNTVDESTMDPIQRAGYRLLCKAAVPIQSSVRRFLAQKEALDRMWGLIELQAYFRRWRCEAYRFAHKWAACKIQSAFRGWQTRQKLDDAIFAAVEIQRIVRGYLATTQVYDRFYSLITVQCAVRGWLSRVKARRQLGIIIVLQSIVRRYLAKLTVQKRIRAATIIQSAYRGYSALLHFQFDIVDIIIVQSIIRRWKALKMASILKIERDQAAATRIQKVWRGFQSYSDFVFSLADILTTQRVARGWLARREAKFMKRIKSATIIQSQWRRYKAQIGSLYKLVHLIIVQSIIRRRLAIRRVRQLRIENWAAETIQSQWRLRRWTAEKKCHEAATTIQSAWRRFWMYSQYLIISFEIIRMQSFYRGHRARKVASLQMGCAIIIQSSMRRCLAFRVAQQLKVIRVLVSANSECLRENIASKRIQRQWRGYKRRKKELYAAAVIHRFFAMVKLEVDREICRQRDKKAKKKKRRSREKVETEEKMLERAWLNVVEIDPYGKKGKIFPLGKISESGSDASRSVPPRVSKSRHMERDRQKPLLTGKAVDVRPFDEMSEVTGASVFNAPARVNTLSRKEMSDDLSLEEAWIDTEILQVKRRRESEEDYLQRHGLQHHTAFQLRDGRPYAPIPHLMRGQRMDAIPPKLNHSTPLQASLVRRQSINTHHVSGMYQPLSAHPQNTFHQMVALQRHDMPPPSPHLVLAHGNSMHAPVSHSNNHFEGYRNRGPSHHPLQSHVNTSRYSDPGYFQGGEPLRTNLGGYARHPRSESPSGSQGYVDYPKPKDRSGYYRG